jgi:ATP-binding cassette subfamily B protein
VTRSKPRVTRQRKIPFVAQMEVTDCGAACLAMVMSYHGCPLPLLQVRDECGISRDGTTALNIVQVAKKHGFSARGLRLEPRGLDSVALPAILHWGFSHFVVLEALRKNGARIIDPAMGPLNVSFEDVSNYFTGVAVEIVTTEQVTVRGPLPSPLWKYMYLFHWLKRPLKLLFVAAFLLQCAGLAFTISAQIIIDRVVPHGQVHLAYLVAIALSLAIISGALLSLFKGTVAFNAQISLDWILRSRLVEHLLLLPLSFFTQRRVGDLTSRVQSNSLIRTVFAERSVTSLLDGLFVVLYFALMSFYSLKLTLCVAVLTLGRLVVHLRFRNDNASAVSTETVAIGREWSSLLEAFSSIETMMAAGAQLRMSHRTFNATISRVNQSIRRRKLESLSALLSLALQGGSLACVVVLGCHELSHNAMTAGQFIAFVTIQGLFAAPLESLVSLLTQLQTLKVQFLRLDDIFATAPQPTSDRAVGALRGAISLKGVACGYTSGGAVIRDVTADIAAGEKVALVGRTGSGKSTLIRALLGMLPLTQGTVLFDGRYSIADVASGDIRKRIGVVLQDCRVFDDTVRNNLSMHDPTVSDADIDAALELACLQNEINRLPQGLNTRLHEAGSRLSGGERQRLCIARALVKKPHILLLDEATSSLDILLQERLYSNIRQLSCTCILITHRVSVLDVFDTVIVLDEGRIVQRGSFATLSSESGLFRGLLLSAREVRANGQ